MSSNIQKRVELFANVAIIIVTILLGYFLVQKFLLSTNSSASQSIAIKKGSKVDISDVDWQKQQQTLVIYVRKGCGYCTKSMPFYKSLTEIQPKINTKLVVVSIDDTNTTKTYLAENGIEFNEIHQANLGSIGVTGTPTLLLLNNKGEVSNSWVGKLTSDEEKEVISQL